MLKNYFKTSEVNQTNSNPSGGKEFTGVNPCLPLTYVNIKLFMHGFFFQVLSHTSTLATNTFTISWRSLVWCMRKSLSLWRNWRVGYAPTSYLFPTHPPAASSKGPQWPWQTSLSMAQQRREKRPQRFFFFQTRCDDYFIFITLISSDFWKEFASVHPILRAYNLLGASYSLL